MNEAKANSPMKPNLLTLAVDRFYALIPELHRFCIYIYIYMYVCIYVHNNFRPRMRCAVAQEHRRADSATGFA